MDSEHGELSPVEAHRNVMNRVRGLDRFQTTEPLDARVEALEAAVAMLQSEVARLSGHPTGYVRKDM